MVKFYLRTAALPAKHFNRQIYREPIQPRVKRGSTLELVDGAPSFQKSFLGEIPSIMLITNNTVEHSEYFRVELSYQLTERLGISRLRSIEVSALDPRIVGERQYRPFTVTRQHSRDGKSSRGLIARCSSIITVTGAKDPRISVDLSHRALCWWRWRVRGGA
jgi:hypothetical protein